MTVKRTRMVGVKLASGGVEQKSVESVPESFPVRTRHHRPKEGAKILARLRRIVRYREQEMLTGEELTIELDSYVKEREKKGFKRI